MTHTIQIDRLTYDPDVNAVTAAISGELGGRHVHVQVQFPLRASTQRDDEARRQSAIAEFS